MHSYVLGLDVLVTDVRPYLVLPMAAKRMEMENEQTMAPQKKTSSIQALCRTNLEVN